MKRVLFITITLTLSLALYSQVRIQHSKAKTQKGKTVHLIGFITGVKQVTNKEDSSILMYLETNDSQRPFVLVIPNTKKVKFKKALAIEYLNQCVQVTGIIKSYKGKPGIILYSDNQIAIAREAAPEEE